MTNLIWHDVDPLNPNFGMKKECWIIVLAICLLPSVLMKELAELKIMSVTLFLSVISFVIILAFQLMLRGSELTNKDPNHNDYWKLHTFNEKFI